MSTVRFKKSMREYYAELHLSPHASQGEIKQAFRQLAKKYHPDKNAGDASAIERFKRINEAYQYFNSEQFQAARQWELEEEINQPSSSIDDRYQELKNMPHVTRIHPRRDRERSRERDITSAKRKVYQHARCSFSPIPSYHRPLPRLKKIAPFKFIAWMFYLYIFIFAIMFIMKVSLI